MEKVLILLALILKFSLSCNNFTSLDGTIIAKTFLYNSIAFVSECPTGSLIINDSCNLSSPVKLFSTLFSSQKSFISKSVGDFKTANNKIFNSMNQSSLLPTKDRGFYSAANTTLILNSSPTPAPDLSIKIWIKLIGTGAVFNINSNLTYFQVWTDTDSTGTYYGFLINICNQSDSACYTISVPYMGYSTLRWEYLFITIQQTTNTTMQLNMMVNYNTYITVDIPDAENAIGIYGIPYSWYIGDNNIRFQGFVYNIEGYNGINDINLPFIDPPDCNNSEYWNGSACAVCLPNCTNWPLCVRSTCNICYSTACLACTGYSSNLCTSYSSPFYFSNCIASVIPTSCAQCETGYLLDQSVCKNSIEFNLMSYAIPANLNSGSNPATYFQNYPEPDDPIGLDKRGFYFNGGSYLNTKDSNVLPASFIIYMWIKGISGCAITKNSEISILYNGELQITLTSLNSTVSYIETIPANLSASWNYISYNITFREFSSSCQT